jgi:glycosyltransferase involved in cell wall biosynthesis
VDAIDSTMPSARNRTNYSKRCGTALRIAHVSLQLDVGGMEKLLVEFARCADRERFDLQFISLGGRGAVADQIESFGWPVVALGEPSGLRPALVLRLAEQFRRLRPDVVHTHNTKPLMYAAPAASLARVRRLVHTRHGQRFGSSRRETTAFRWAARIADRVVCVSDDSARLSVQEGLRRDCVVIVKNGIDLSRFSYSGCYSKGPAIMVGRLSPEKDVETLVRAAAIARAADPSFELEIVGGGSCLNSLRSLAAELGLERQVRFLGERSDVPALLARAGLFVLPSLTEGISLTLLEAMARGLPVVATRVGGNPEVVVDAETGLLVTPKAPAELAGAMLRLRSSPAEARRMGAAGRRRVEEHFDVRRMVADYESVYAAVAGRADAGSTRGGECFGRRTLPQGDRGGVLIPIAAPHIGGKAAL